LQKDVITLFTFSGVWTECEHPVGLKSITGPPSHNFDTHNNRVLQVDATLLSNYQLKPRCVAIIEFVLISNPYPQFYIAAANAPY
jgi:hypothetical protein